MCAARVVTHLTLMHHETEENVGISGYCAEAETEPHSAKDTGNDLVWTDLMTLCGQIRG